jgi:uncharacterized protein (DUF433 family)
MSTSTPHHWVYLDRKPGSLYRQLFVKGRNIAARTLYGHFMSEEEPRTPEQIAEDYELPIEAVREAIAYCDSNPPEIQRDWEADQALQEAAGMNDPEYKKHWRTRRLTLDEIDRISRL